MNPLKHTVATDCLVIDSVLCTTGQNFRAFEVSHLYNLGSPLCIDHINQLDTLCTLQVLICQNMLPFRLVAQ